MVATWLLVLGYVVVVLLITAATWLLIVANSSLAGLTVSQAGATEALMALVDLIPDLVDAVDDAAGTAQGVAQNPLAALFGAFMNNRPDADDHAPEREGPIREDEPPVGFDATPLQ